MNDSRSISVGQWNTIYKCMYVRTSDHYTCDNCNNFMLKLYTVCLHTNTYVCKENTISCRSWSSRSRSFWYNCGITCFMSFFVKYLLYFELKCSCAYTFMMWNYSIRAHIRSHIYSSNCFRFGFWVHFNLVNDSVWLMKEVYVEADHHCRL